MIRSPFQCPLSDCRLTQGFAFHRIIVRVQCHRGNTLILDCGFSAIARDEHCGESTVTHLHTCVRIEMAFRYLTCTEKLLAMPHVRRLRHKCEGDRGRDGRGFDGQTLASGDRQQEAQD